MAWSRRIIVQERRWLSAEEFNEQLALSLVLPGANIVNFAVMYGYRARRRTGLLAALLSAWIGPPTVLMIIAGTLYRRYGEMPVLRQACLPGLPARRRRAADRQCGADDHAPW